VSGLGMSCLGFRSGLGTSCSGCRLFRAEEFVVFLRNSKGFRAHTQNPKP
jgi:hypothetical protein